MLLFIYRFFITLTQFLLICLPLQLIGIIILLPICFFYDIGNLPYLLRWFDSADPFVGRDISVITLINKQGYWAKYCWLAWRNPINYFDYTITGFQFDGTEEYTIYNPEEDKIGDSVGSIPGLRYIEIHQTSSNMKFYEYYFIHKWSDTVCLRFRLGWKIANKNNPKGSYCQDCFVISPYKSYSGL